ncbi:MAG: 3-hydroxyacyl-CoA dehydrogenase family protein [Candidatus Thorarchaeota archaeon]
MSNEIKNVSIIGIGNLGKQIAEWSALYNYKVSIFDTNQEGIKEYIDEALKKVKEKNAVGEIINYNSIKEVVRNADLIIEAVPEKLELKKEIFSQIDNSAPSHAIIATNSSSIPVSRIENVVKRKDKVLNLHFYKLPDFPMADIARGTETSDDTFNAGKNWLESIDVTPLVLKKECLGFVFNRVWRAIKKESLKIWSGGYADLEDLDKAWKIFTGMNVGPFGLMDIVGLDVVFDIEMMYYKESGDPDDKPPQMLKEMVDKGYLGVKTGRGFYNYE